MNTDLQAMYSQETTSPRSKIAATTALEKRTNNKMNNGGCTASSLNKTMPFTLTKQNLLFAINNSDGSLRFEHSQKKKKRSSKSFIARVDAPFKKSDNQNPVN